MVSYFYSPDEIDIGDCRHEHFLYKGEVSVSVLSPVDDVIWNEECENVNQDSQSQGQVSCNKEMKLFANLASGKNALRRSKNVEMMKRKQTRAEA